MSVDFQIRERRTQEPLHLKMFHEWKLEDGTLWTRFYRSDADYLLRFFELGDFRVSADGRTVRCWPAPGVSDGTMRHLHLNQVLPLALSRQGKLVFHASAVEIDARAVAFMGESGKGKSTLAVSFATNGFRFLADDGLLVDSTQGQLQIAPSHPSIRLWEDSQEALLDPATPTAPPVQFTSKSRFLAGANIAFCEQARELRCVYFLGNGTQRHTVIERLNPGEALIELLKHSFLLDIEERQVLATHFDELVNMVARPIYYRLDFPREFAELARVRQAIVDHTFEERLAG